MAVATRMLTTFLLLYLCCCSSTSAGSGGMVIEGYKQGIMVDPNLPLHYKEDGYQEVKQKNKVMMPRKVLMMDVADYDETGANSKHDPRKGRHP